MDRRVPITIKLTGFEGPLDLLLHLIHVNELNVSTVSIGRITDQYLAYLRTMEDLNFEVASDFLVMAATLLYWKSKAILPKEGEEELSEDEERVLTPEELLRQLLEHQRFLAAGDDLAQLPRLHEDVFARTPKRPPAQKVWKEMDVTSLALTYQDMLARARKRKTILKKETVSLASRITEFGYKLKLGEVTEMEKLMGPIPDKPEKVVTFLASLELARLRKLKVYQQEVYAKIYVELLESLEDFNTQLATGFDQLEQRTEDEPGHGPAAESQPATDTAGV